MNQKHSIRDDFTLLAMLLIPVGVAINFIGGQLAQILKLPVFLDTIGTILTAMLCGPWVGAVAGGLTNVFTGIANPVNMAFIPVNIVIGLATGLLAKCNMFSTWWKCMISIIVRTAVGICSSIPIIVIVYGGVTGATGASLITATLLASGANIWATAFSTEGVIQMVDAFLSFGICWAVIKLMPQRTLVRFKYGMNYIKGHKITNKDNNQSYQYFMDSKKKIRYQKQDFVIPKGSYLEKIQIHKNNKLAGLYPGVKFLVVILYSISTLILSTIRITTYQLPLFMIPWFFIVLILCVCSGEMEKCLKSLKAVVVVAIVVFIVQTFIIQNGDVIWKYGFLQISSKGLQSGMSLPFAILDVAGIFVWLFQTTSNKEIEIALEEANINYKAAFVFASSLSMINILNGNSKTVMNAQMARGIETKGNLFKRAKAFFSTLAPLILSAVVNAEERVLTLEARGFSTQCEKTHLVKLEKSGLEKPIEIISIVMFIGIVVWRILL